MTQRRNQHKKTNQNTNKKEYNTRLKSSDITKKISHHESNQDDFMDDRTFVPPPSSVNTTEGRALVPSSPDSSSDESSNIQDALKYIKKAKEKLDRQNRGLKDISRMRESQKNKSSTPDTIVVRNDKESPSTTSKDDSIGGSNEAILAVQHFGTSDELNNSARQIQRDAVGTHLIDNILAEADHDIVADCIDYRNQDNIPVPMLPEFRFESVAKNNSPERIRDDVSALSGSGMSQKIKKTCAK